MPKRLGAETYRGRNGLVPKRLVTPKSPGIQSSKMRGLGFTQSTRVTDDVIKSTQEVSVTGNLTAEIVVFLCFNCQTKGSTYVVSTE